MEYQRIGSAINSRSDRDRRSDRDLINDHILGLISDRDLIWSPITFIVILIGKWSEISDHSFPCLNREILAKIEKFSQN